VTRPKVLMPEKTESACEAVSIALIVSGFVLLADLSAAITWQRVVPQRLVRSLQWLLVSGMVAVSSHARGESGDGSNELEHLDVGRNEEEEDYQGTPRGVEDPRQKILETPTQLAPAEARVIVSLFTYSSSSAMRDASRLPCGSG